MQLILTNNLSKNSVIWDGIDDKNDTSLFYHFNINLYPNMEDGEYTYELKEGDEVLSSGLLQIGDYERDMDINKEYNDNESGFIVYDGK